MSERAQQSAISKEQFINLAREVFSESSRGPLSVLAQSEPRLDYLTVPARPLRAGPASLRSAIEDSLCWQTSPAQALLGALNDVRSTTVDVSSPTWRRRAHMAVFEAYRRYSPKGRHPIEKLVDALRQRTLSSRSRVRISSALTDLGQFFRRYADRLQQHMSHPVAPERRLPRR